MNLRRLVGLAVGVSAAILVELLWLPLLPWLHLGLNITLLVVIALTIGERLLVGMIAAAMAGVTFIQFTAVSGPAYLLAFLAASGAAWFFSQKIVTTRSAISFISTVMVGTVSYSVVLIMVDIILSVINRQRLHFDLVAVSLAGVVQLIIHPLLLSIYWRMFGRHQYHRLSTSPTKSF